MMRPLLCAAVAASALTCATFAHASIGCVDATYRPQTGRAEDGKKVQAKLAAQKAIDISPSFAEAKELLAKLN